MTQRTESNVKEAGPNLLHISLTAIAVTVGALMCGAGCGGDTPTQPSLRGTRFAPFVPLPPAPSDLPFLVGGWEGSSTVESIAGVAPSCVPPFWRPLSTGAISVAIRQFDGSKLDMALNQRASEECHLQLTEAQGRVTGTPWPYDEFDCAMVPSLCGLGCHFRLNTAGWNCTGTPPEVWISGVFLTATVADDSPDRMLGTIEATYDHRPGDSTRASEYSRINVVTGFDVRKVSQ